MTREESEQLLQELEAKVSSGEYVKEFLGAGYYLPEDRGSYRTLTKNINKYPFFVIETMFSIHRYCGQFVPSTDGMGGASSSWTEYEDIPDSQAFTRDYIKKWTIDNDYYTIYGDFGDGTKFHHEQLIKKDIDLGEVEYQQRIETFVYLENIYGYRPKRKTIYIYKKPIRDTNVYLTSSLDELLYTSDNKQIAVADGK